jgi:ADP-ribose pyrophosphatase YjhB (NUDIX family)
VTSEPQWLAWAKRIQAIAQAGLTYSESSYDQDRYQALRALSVEIMASHLELADGERPRLAELFASDYGYPTPKVDVRAFVAADGKGVRGSSSEAVAPDGHILMVRERADGRWSIPGGWADVGSSPAEMAVRETAEESGYQVKARRLLAVWDKARHNPSPFPADVYKLVVACDLVGGDGTAGSETLEVGWFAPDRLPELSVGRITAAQIHRLAELHAHPELPPDLD